MNLRIHQHRDQSALSQAGQRQSHETPGRKYYTDYRNSNLEGFIHHPPGFPIEWRSVRQKKAGQPDTYNPHSHIGLCFETDKYIKPGTLLELVIRLRGEDQRFTGRVILVRNKGTLFETGVWFTSRPEASRLRIVEQICHIEAYLKHKRHHEGPFVSPERVAQEWIARFASTFPSFG